MGVEQELIEAAGFNPRKPYKERQDHLTALLKSVDELDDAEFDNLSDEATDWLKIAALAYKAKEEIPEFEDGEEAVDHEAQEAAEDAQDDAEGGEDAEKELAEEIEAEEAPKAKKGQKIAKANGKKPNKEAAEKPAKAEKEPEAKKPVKKVTKAPDADDITIDKWGVMVGTKTHDALVMFEKGATTADVKEKVGGTYYNALRKLVAEGHHMEKDGPFIRIIHKDDYGAKAKGKKK